MGLFLIFSVLSVFCSTLVSSATTSCKYQNDKLIGSRCYSFITKKHQFKAAAEYCHSHGFFLATVDNQINDNFLASMAGSEFGKTTGTFWIGLHRKVDFSLFQWDDGTQFAFTNFDRGYPNTHDYVSESISNGKWKTEAEHEELEFVCSYNPDMKTTPTPAPTTSRLTTTTTKSTPTTPTTTHKTSPKTTNRSTRIASTSTPTLPPTTTRKPGCPEGFTLFEGDKKCYIVLVYGNDEDYPVVSDDAPPLTREAQRCAKYGSQLATIHFEELNDLLRSLIYNRFYDSRYATIGMKNVNEVWQWYDGSKKDFTNFSDSFPRTGDTIAQTSSSGNWVTFTRTAPNEGVVCSVDY